MMQFKIRNIDLNDLDEVKLFTDKWIGKDYFTKEELRNSLLKGSSGEHNASFMALNKKGQIIGVRITYLPGEWMKEAELLPHVSPFKWKVTEKKVAYFKSLFIAEDYRRKGIGKDLTLRSLQVLHNLGTLAVLCHSWVESPSNSSKNYLTKMRFESIKIHPDFWFFKEYSCILCSPKNCGCSAEEMIYYLPQQSDEEDVVIQGTR